MRDRDREESRRRGDVRRVHEEKRWSGGREETERRESRVADIAEETGQAAILCRAPMIPLASIFPAV